MNYKSLILVVLFLSHSVFSQVGINNQTPKSTLDITANTTDGSKPEGIIAPRLTGDQIKLGDSNYTSAQSGAIIYATAAVTSASSKTANITSTGYYYFDGSLWQKMSGGGGGSSANIYNADGTLASNRTVTMNANTLTFQGADSSTGSVKINGGTSSQAGSVGIYKSDGTTRLGYLGFDDTNLTYVAENSAKHIFSGGNVGINTSSPSSALEVNGTATNTTAYNAGNNTTIDFGLSNLAYTTANPGNAFTLNNIKDGGTYSLAVRGTTSGTATFTAAGFTFKSISNTPTIEGKQTMYTFVVMGTTVYVYTNSGF